MNRNNHVDLVLTNELLRLSAPFRISGHVFHESPVTLVTLRRGHWIGRGARIFNLGSDREFISRVFKQVLEPMR